ncbi:MAG: hypothetical protein CL878_02205 [Dehalococcoidia bacterium]|nr:hypothetical protein [Dehalococcoidia bacterium]
MSDTSIQDTVIEPLAAVPERLLGVRRELNLLRYGPSELLVARRQDEIVGAVRLARRDDPELSHGLITDLAVETTGGDDGLAERLIQAGEQRLRESEIAKIDALIVDGQGLALPFYSLGYWSSRRTVVLGWDLANLADIPMPDHVRIVQTAHPDPEQIGRLVLNSYQPYWTWWKDPRKDQKWYRVELQPTDLPGYAERAEGRVREAVESAIGRANGPGEPEQTYVIAYDDGCPVALCDAKVSTGGEDAFDWGVLVLREFGGKGLASALLGRALHWLRDQGETTADLTVTSGLDDYDPIVYVATVANRAQIRGEFLNLVKRVFDD